MVWSERGRKGREAVEETGKGSDGGKGKEMERDGNSGKGYAKKRRGEKIITRNIFRKKRVYILNSNKSHL